MLDEIFDKDYSTEKIQIVNLIMQKLPLNTKLVFASITGGRVKEITSAGSDCDIRYIYIHKDKNLNIKCIEQSAIIESFKQELPNIKIDSKSVDFSGALSLCS